MDWYQLLNSVMPYLLTFVFAILGDKYLKTYEKKESAAKIVEFAEDAVLFIEDFAKNNPTVISGAEKFKMAIKWVKSAMKSAGYPIPDDTLVEGKVAAAFQKSPYNHHLLG